MDLFIFVVEPNDEPTQTFDVYADDLASARNKLFERFGQLPSEKYYLERRTYQNQTYDVSGWKVR